MTLPSPYRASHRAFTLVELLLAVVLLLGLLGAVVYNFSSLQKGALLDEGGIQVEALFRFARAHAAATGRQVRLEFSEPASDPSTAQPPQPAGEAKPVRVTWEPNPIQAPGIFEELPQAANYVDAIGQSISVRQVRFDPSKPAPPPTDDAPPPPVTPSPNPTPDEPLKDPMLPVTFYPDGSGDSVQVVLASLNTDDDRRLAVSMVGVTGSIQRRIMPDPPVDSETRPLDPAPEAAADAVK